MSLLFFFYITWRGTAQPVSMKFGSYAILGSRSSLHKIDPVTLHCLATAKNWMATTHRTIRILELSLEDAGFSTVTFRLLMSRRHVSAVIISPHCVWDLGIPAQSPINWRNFFCPTHTHTHMYLILLHATGAYLGGSTRCVPEFVSS